jgi:hypothetical protein
MNNAIWSVVAILALIVGIFAGAVAFPTEKVVFQDKIVEKQVAVEKNVTNTVVVDKFAETLANATNEYKVLLKDNDNDELVCDDVEYDFDQISFLKQSNVAMSVDTSDKDDTVTTVTFDQKIKFSDKDVETKCYRTDSVTVVFHSDSDVDTEVSID